MRVVYRLTPPLYFVFTQMTALPHGWYPAMTYTHDLCNQTRSRSLEFDRPGRSRLRRVVSTKGFSQHMDSSESVPSEHSSLYDAVLASFESDDSRRQRELDRHLDEAGPSNYGPTNFVGENMGTINQRLVYSHGKWPGKKLETIVEQRSASTLRGSLAPSVGDVDGPGNNRPLTTQEALVNPPGTCGRKVYSFDDLDLPNRRPRDGASRLPNRSSSSGASFELRGLFPHISPVEPTQPVYPPPVRSPTPPGLPSFGSREAIHYAPTQSNRSRPSNHYTPLSHRGLQQGLVAEGDEEDDLCCASGLKRLFGLPSCMGARPPTLPTGAVARAHDGTMVRGRFGPRQSGHGVGAGPTARGLESHPFHRSSLPAARVKDGCDSAPNSVVVSQQNTHSASTPSQTGYSSPQIMPLSYSSLLRARTAPHIVPPRRSCTNTGNCTLLSTPSVPLPSYVAHQRLESPLPRPPEMIHASNSPSGLNGPGPEGGENDGTSATLTPSRPNRPPIVTGPRRRQRISMQTAIIEDNKAPGLWDWLLMDCFFVCCGLFGGKEPPLIRSQRGNFGIDGQCSAPDQTAASAAAADGQIRTPLNRIHDRDRHREISSPTPWTPAWGWQPRCFGGDATLDEETGLGTAIELRLIQSTWPQETAAVN
ncbi:hypothetical protein I7I50_07017 [Histoplasma capsulatum G186AR]|nr:hypothetical protein I7I52_09909 [Histoplasma capsulatum]QSS67825.1 hypothetical protein I7I50_07017 [Histoplasma capsulatum G186AR]